MNGEGDVPTFSRLCLSILILIPIESHASRESIESKSQLAGIYKQANTVNAMVTWHVLVYSLSKDIC